MFLVLKKDLQIFLQINDKQNLDLFSLNYKLFFQKNLLNLKLYEDTNTERLYINANKLVQYGGAKKLFQLSKKKV